MKEYFIPIRGFEDRYSISNIGRVKSEVSNIYLKLAKNRGGYLYVNLWKNGKGYVKKIHRLVAIHFLKNSELKEQVNHKDCNKLNNRIDNLEWCSQLENMRHAYKNGIIPFSPLIEKMRKLNIHKVRIIRLLKKINPAISNIKIGEYFGVKNNTISDILLNKRWKVI